MPFALQLLLQEPIDITLLEAVPPRLMHPDKAKIIKLIQRVLPRANPQPEQPSLAPNPGPTNNLPQRQLLPIHQPNHRHLLQRKFRSQIRGRMAE
jgi:hypothetical protein